MSYRKKRLIFIQTVLFLAALLLLYIFYYQDNVSKQPIVKVKTENENLEKLGESNFFEDIEYKGIDANGNRYLLKSKIASFDEKSPELVNMIGMNATFYFKDGTVLNVSSETGVYNNKSLDMLFSGEVKSSYNESKLFADKAEYSNSEGFLTITKNVIIEDSRGTMIADELLFDIKKQTLKIAAFKDNKINANIKLKWKKVLGF